MSISNSYNLVCSVTKKKWSLVLYDERYLYNYFFGKKEYIAHYYKMIIDSVQSEVDIDNVYISENSLYLNKDNQCFNICYLPMNKNILLFLKSILHKQHNIIFFNCGCGYIKYDKDKMVMDDIYALYLDKCGYDLYADILCKYDIDKIISSRIMIIPYSLKNYNFIKDAGKIEKLIGIISEDTVKSTDISLTISQKKFALVKKLVLNPNFIVSIDKKIHNTVTESFLTNLTNLTNTLVLNFDDSNYHYYPYLDVWHTNIPKTNINDADIINSNWIVPHITDNDSVYSKMFNRFDDKNAGLYIRKSNYATIIPKIVHHIWLFEEPNIAYTNLWARILRKPWKYIIWTQEMIVSTVLIKGKWKILYEAETDNDIRYLIVCFAILDMYGGIVVESYSLLLRMIPDELLKNNFVISFLDEANTGTKLMYKIMASIPNLELLVHFYSILGNNENSTHRIKILENFIICNKIPCIYPSYYFNPNNNLIPPKYLKMTIAITLWKKTIKQCHIKTPIKRKYIVTDQSIIAKLKENPRDRLSNLS